MKSRGGETERVALQREEYRDWLDEAKASAIGICRTTERCGGMTKAVRQQLRQQMDISTVCSQVLMALMH